VSVPARAAAAAQVPSLSLRMRDRTVELPAGEPLLMGIVNATPDSFSDPGRRDVGELAARAHALVGAGASLIDVGGESGRTDTVAVSVDEEIARVVPLVKRLADDGIAVSVDTWRAPVAEATLAAGAAMINDVSGLTDPGIADACAASGAALVVTHTRSEPKTKVFPVYPDVMADVIELLLERAATARERGVGEDQLVYDPGIDLAKTPADSIAVLRRLGELAPLGRPLLAAISRKDFIGALTGRPPAARLAGTLATLGVAVDGGARIVRVHDVADAADYLRVRGALRGEVDVAPDLHLAEELRREPA
jgi:dihydropteroate synthase